MAFTEYPSTFSIEQQVESIRKGVAGVFTALLDLAGWTNTDVFGWKHTVSGGSIVVNTATYKAAVSNTVGTKTFTYVVAQLSWQLAGVNVSLSTYGITLTGAPSNGNTIVVEYAIRKTQTLNIPGLLESSNYTVAPLFSTDELPSDQDSYVDAMGAILRFYHTNNSITFISYRASSPKVSVPIQIWEA